MQKRECIPAPAPSLPVPVPLPNLKAAFAIRQEVFGAVPITDDGEVRALTLYDVVPAGHIAVPVMHSRWAPHLKVGEFAILEVTDTEPQFGELYGLMIDSPRYQSGQVLKIVQPYRSKLFAGCAGVIYRFSLPRPGRLPMADGPLTLDGWHQKCRGRIVGVLALDEVEVANG